MVIRKRVVAVYVRFCYINTKNNTKNNRPHVSQ
jgi:hypothetical protein